MSDQLTKDLDNIVLNKVIRDLKSQYNSPKGKKKNHIILSNMHFKKTFL